MEYFHHLLLHLSHFVVLVALHLYFPIQTTFFFKVQNDFCKMKKREQVKVNKKGAT